MENPSINPTSQHLATQLFLLEKVLHWMQEWDIQVICGQFLAQKKQQHLAQAGLLLSL